MSPAKPAAPNRPATPAKAAKPTKPLASAKPAKRAKPSVSVFTPSHRPTYLDEAFASLQRQTFPDWEWIVLLNQGARWSPPHPDSRVRVLLDRTAVGVGQAKQRACAKARGELLVELDHDDLLASGALEALVKARADQPQATLLYSDFAQVMADGSRDDSRFAASAGWTYQEVTVDGRDLLSTVAMAATPHNVSYIWWAPNHVRAFPMDAYKAAGGYDPKRTVLDDQDLMCRLYQLGPFHRISDCLYLQRMHEHNTQRDAETNAFIQQETIALYDRHLERNALAWARREGLLALDLGAAHNRPEGYLGVDQHPGADVDIVATLPGPLDLPDSSVGVIRAFDFMEHVADKIGLINELHRLLAPGGLLLSMTPSTDGRGAFQDPTHVAYYNENSFWYYTEATYRNYVPEITAKFQTSRMYTACPTEWHAQHNISYVVANLIAVKEPMDRNGGYYFW
jgi:glycosyltransferase involved in cell wall biosynthesis